MLGRGGLAGYGCAEIALRRRILRHTVPSRLSYAWGVLRRWTATAAFSNGTLALRCLNSWAWCGAEPYRSMLSQAHPVPRAFGLPVVRIQSCLAVPPFWNQHGPGFWPRARGNLWEPSG